MKKSAIYILAGLFLMSLVAGATSVDVATKQNSPSTIVKKKDKTQEDTTKETPKSPDPAPKTQPQQKKYDDFQDKNNNGIDDRKENLKTKDTDKTDTKDKKKDPTP